MKKLIAALIITASLTSIGASAVAAGLPPAYQAVYCYPSGTYWQKQISKFPDYYSQNDAQFKAKYGSGTKYCAS